MHLVYRSNIYNLSMHLSLNQFACSKLPAQFRPNSCLRVVPKREIASAIASELAAANVARKNNFSSLAPWALNQLPREISTPLLTAAWKTSSSISSRVLPDESPGCFRQSISIQCCFLSVPWSWGIKDSGKLWTYKHPCCREVPMGKFSGEILLTRMHHGVSASRVRHTKVDQPV